MLLPQPGSGTGHLHADATDTFAALFKQYYLPLVYFARKMITDSLMAEDIVTDVFIKFWQKHNQFPSHQTVKAFLYISTKNACLNYIDQRRYQARAKQTLRAMSDENVESVLTEISRAEVLREVFYLVESLPLQCRKIVLMSFVAGLSNRQIARRLQLSEHTVRNQKVRGIQLMRSRALMCA